MKNKINLPTKITISRIFLAVILIIAIFILYFLDLYGVFEISSMNIWINKDKNIYINGILLIFLFCFCNCIFNGYIRWIFSKKK